MTVIRHNSISGISSINAQSDVINFYDNSGVPISIAATFQVGTGATISGETNTIIASTNDIERLRIDSSGRLLVGTSSNRTNFALQLEGTNYNQASLSLTNNQNTGNSGYVYLTKTRGTAVGSNTIVNDGDPLGIVEFAGADGSNLVTAAKIEARVDGTPGANDMPGRLTFHTTAVGASTPTERMRIDSSGRLLVGSSSARSPVSATPLIQVEGTTYAKSSISITQNSNDSNSANFYLAKSRGGSLGSHAVISNNDEIGSIDFLGADGSQMVRAARIQCVSDGTPDTNDMPGRLVFSTTADGASIPTERMRIDSSGRLLVGTNSSSQSAKLTVQGNANSNDEAFLDLNRGTDPANNQNVAVIRFTQVGSREGARISAQRDSGVWGAASHPTRLVFSTTADGQTSPTERMRIDSSGRMLVGTSTGRNNWYGSYLYTPQIQNEGNGIATSMITNTVNSNSSSGPYLTFGKTRGTTDGSNTAVQNGDTLGNIDFQGADGTYLQHAARIRCQVDGTPGSADMPGRLVFYTTADGANMPTERMRITKEGRFHASSDTASSARYGNDNNHSVSTSTGGQYVFVVENDNASDPYGVLIDYDNASPDNTGNAFLECRDSTATRMEVRSDGDVWTSDSGVLTSDATLKRDITDATPKLDDLMRLRVRNFYWIPEYHPNKQDKKLIGFIAQEVEEVFPGLVSNDNRISGGDIIYDEEGNDTGEKTPEVLKKGLKEGKLIPILVKALQEAVERIETLEAEVASLKGA
jgi:hypothetical protein